MSDFKLVKSRYEDSYLGQEPFHPIIFGFILTHHLSFDQLRIGGDSDPISSNLFSDIQASD